jgi:hypothetical protein
MAEGVPSAKYIVKLIDIYGEFFTHKMNLSHIH